jgi:mono/diheme cytochrome c family protein
VTSSSRRLQLALLVPVLLLFALQIVPYGRDHSAPADGAQPVWDSPRTKELAERACLDCHTNRTRWPWYSNIAPISWRLQAHVQEGREKLNFSAFDPTREPVAEAAEEAGESVTKQEMPPFDYLLAHPEARLTAEERRALAAGLDATFAAFAEHGRGAAPGVPGQPTARRSPEHDRGEHGSRDTEAGEHGRGRGRSRGGR